MEPITLAILSTLALAGSGAFAHHQQSKLLKDSNDTARWSAEQELKSANPEFYEYLKSTGALDGVLDAYVTKTKDLTNLYGLTGSTHTYDTNNMLAQLKQLSDADSLPIPDAPNFNTIYDEALKSLEDENAAIEDLYDDDLERQTSMYQNQLADSNRAYNQNVEQILSNDAQNSNRLLGTMRSELQRSQRNALEAGASAGMRIAGNINTALSVQNQQAQQSLDTSNNLAQMLLNQQQANAGLRNEYGNYLSQDTARRAGLKSGMAERAENMANTRFNTEQIKYNNAMENRERKYSATVGATNSYKDTYEAYKVSQNSKTN